MKSTFKVLFYLKLIFVTNSLYACDSIVITSIIKIFSTKVGSRKNLNSQLGKSKCKKYLLFESIILINK